MRDWLEWRFDRIEAKLVSLTILVNQVLKQENKMAIDLTSLTAEVANSTTVTASVKQLIENLAAQIAAIPPSTDPVTQAALDALTSTLATNDAAIAAAVLANTPQSSAAAVKSTS